MDTREIENYINNGRQRHQRNKTVTILSNLMASTYVLSSRTFNLHWNTGSTRNHYLDNHIKNQYEDLNAAVGKIAAQIRTLGWEISGRNHVNSFPGAGFEMEDLPVILADLARNHDQIASFIQGHLQDVADARDEATLVLLEERLSIHRENTKLLREISQRQENPGQHFLFREGNNELVFINLA